MSDCFVTPWTIVLQALLSIGFPRQEYWRRLSFSSPGDLPDPGIEPTSSVSPEQAGGVFATKPAGKPNGQWPGVNTVNTVNTVQRNITQRPNF